MNCRWIGLIVVALLTTSCVYHDISEPVNCDASGLKLEVIDSVDAFSCQQPDGSITVGATGGKAPYYFSLDDGLEQQSPVFSDLASKLYSVTVRDVNNCAVQRDNILISVENFDAYYLFTDDTDCLSPNGTMEVTVNESNGPFQFNLNASGFTANNFFEAMKHGDHFLEIRGSDGCNVTKRVTVPRGFTSVSWENDILPIMTESCALVGCHNGISRPNDWRIYSQVRDSASVIRIMTQSKEMPFDSSLPHDEIDLIACWIDDGALEN